MLISWLKRIPFLLLFLTFCFLTLGFFYQLAVSTRDQGRYPPPGKFADVGGYRLHYKITGESGPLVVLDAGMGCNSLDWIFVEPEIAKFARVLTYDRAGYGWSDVGPEPRTSRQIVKELHELLNQINIPGPYIFIGHSFGGLNVRLYAAEYPEDVSGLVLVDASHEDQIEALPFIPYNTYTEILHALSFFAPFGSHRWLIPYIFGDDLKTYPQALRDLRKAMQCKNQAIRTAYAELRDFSESLNQMRAKTHFKLEKPLFVLSAGKVDPVPGFDPQTLQMFMKVWGILQNKLADQSLNGKTIIAEKSGHMIHWEQPELIIEAVNDLVLKKR